MDDAAVEQQLRDLFEARAEPEGIAAAWLFGCSARAISGSKAEVEIGILLRDWPGRPGAKERELVMRLKGEIEDLLGLPAGIVILNDCQWLELVFEMLRDDQLLVESDRARRVEFEMRTRQEFCDFEPYLRLYRNKKPT